ncbi:hypothetical protein BH10PSE17_BH10PSE17_05590 [soil metagenome]
MKLESSAKPVWVLLGARQGDRQQLLAMAEALGLPYRTIQLRFKLGSRLPPGLLRSSRLTWDTEAPLEPPWPDIVIAAGRKSVPAALRIRRLSGGSTRLIHVNRPCAPLDWFDLVITTPQYALPRRPNVLANLMPFVPPVPAALVDLPQDLQDRMASMPRPWTLVLVGGNSRPYVFDDAAAARLATVVNQQVGQSGGSACVLDSPRTPASVMATLARHLTVPAHVVERRAGQNPYRSLLGQADRFIVTSDSASMLTEALFTGRPVTPFRLEAQPDLRWRLTTRWREAALDSPDSLSGRLFTALFDLGVLSAVRDVGLMQQALEQAGAFRPETDLCRLAEQERRVTLSRIAALTGRPVDVVPASVAVSRA